MAYDPWTDGPTLKQQEQMMIDTVNEEARRSRPATPRRTRKGPDTRVFLKRGDRARLVLPYSEVCVHMHVADKTMIVELTETDGAQLYTLEGKRFSSPILPSEAGLFCERATGRYYFYPKSR